MWLAPSWFGSGVFWVRQFSNTDSLSYGRLSWVSPWGVVLWQSKYLDLSSSVSYPSNILLGPFTHFEQSSFQDGFQQTLSQGWSWPRGKQTEPWSLCIVKLYVAQVHSTGYPSALLSWVQSHKFLFWGFPGRCQPPQMPRTYNIGSQSFSGSSPEMKGASPSTHQLCGGLGTYFHLHIFMHTYFSLSI